ncbi:MAG: hypothetical protein IIU97_02815, partial [Bacteroidaceae bacterium]|nr:hypothetical protein [Bacteroidaceae bacterium]
MKRAFVLLLVLATALPSFSAPPQKDGEKELSPFVGKWGWAGNALEHRFFVWCGERNDSLLFTIGGTFFYGDRIHMPEHAKNGDFIQMVRVKKPKGNIARSKMYEIMSNFYFYCGDEKKLNDVTFELLSDTVMLFILDDNKAYWPDTAAREKLYPADTAAIARLETKLACAKQNKAADLPFL